MTKEELEKEAGEWLKSNIKTEKREGITFNIVPTPMQIYCAGAEPREKQIAELGERCLQLQRDKGNLTDRVNDLEAQIEKMKCCQICKHYQWENCNYHSLNEKDCKANNHRLFELVGDKRK